MDVDEVFDTSQLALEWITLFDLTPNKFPWRDPIPEEIEARRNQMSDKLIFDLLLASARIPQPDILFPPTDVESLRRLLDAVQNSSFDTLKKDCVVYWLLKWHQDGRAKAFREARCIPPQFVTLADAYWLLDTGIDVEKAVSMLSDSRITPEYPSKVLQALSLSEDPHVLIVKYVRTAKPSLMEPEDVDLYTLALAESCPSLLEAWQFQRTFPESNATRSRLIEKILDWCLSPKPRSGPLSQLLGFPFSIYEQSMVHKYALHPPSTCPPDSIPVVQDLVCVRLIQSGQYAAAVKLDGQFVIHMSHPSAKMHKAIQDRKRMMEEVMAAMPTVEREILEAELEQLAQGKSGTSESTLGNTESWTGISNNFNSREDLHASRLASNGLANFPIHSPAQLFGAIPTMSLRDGQTPLGKSLPPSVPSGGTPFSPNAPLFASAAHRNLSSVNTAPSAHTSSPSRFAQSPLISTPQLSQPVPKATPPPSLFSSVGSATMSRNAFYNPPATNGVKRPFGQDYSRPVPVIDQPPPTARIEDDDVNMDVVEEPPSGLSYSLFGTSTMPDNGYRQGGQRVARTDTEAKMPPGAFFESDDEAEVSQATRKSSRRQISSSPPSPPTKRRTRNRKAPIPGALIADDEEEEGDHVAPLPASPPPGKRPTRKNKTSSRTSSVNSEQPRRSTRLSVRVSSSPEPVSKKTRKGTRTVTEAKASAKGGARKKT